MNDETFSPKLTINILLSAGEKGVPINMVKVVDCFLGIGATGRCEKELNELRDFIKEKVHCDEDNDMSAPLIVNHMYTEITQGGSTVDIILGMVGNKDEIMNFVQELKDRFGFHVLINPAW